MGFWFCWFGCLDLFVCLGNGCFVFVVLGYLWICDWVVVLFGLF